MRRWTVQAVPLDPDDAVAARWARSWNSVVWKDDTLLWFTRRAALRFASGDRPADRAMGVRTVPVKVADLGWPR